MKSEKIYNILILLIFLILHFISKNDNLICFGLFILILFKVLNGYGHTLNLANLIALHSVIVYLVAPQLGYMYYTDQNAASKLWGMFMPIPAQQYYSYMLPSIIAFMIGLNIFKVENEKFEVNKLLNIIRSESLNKIYLGYVLIAIGLIALNLRPYMPPALAYVAMICFLMIFPGMVFIYYLERKTTVEYVTLSVLIAWILLSAIKNTMFTIVVYMGVTISGLIFLNLKWSLSKKGLTFFILFISILGIQLTKMKTRKTIYDTKDNVTVSEFSKSFLGNVKLISNGIDPVLFFPIYVRINQGRLTAKVLQYMPAKKPFDHGNRLFTAILSSFIPRLFWPTKPQAGGRENMQYYARLTLQKASMNVGPPGEAYGSFGAFGGTIYIFLFGCFLSLAIRVFIKLSIKKPLLLLWMPLIFFESVYSMETDSLQAFNSIFKISILLFFLFKFFPILISSSLKPNIASTS